MSQKETTFMDEVRYFEDGAVVLYQRTDTKKPIWHYRLRVNDTTHRYYTRSSKTCDFDRARQVAMEKYWEMRTLQKHGDVSRLFARPFDKVANEFIEHSQERFELGFDSGYRLKRVKRGAKLWKQYLGNKPITDLKRSEVDAYATWRRKQRPDIKKTSLNHEYAIYRQIMEFAVERRYVRYEEVARDGFRVERRDKGRKSGFNSEEWQTLYRTMRQWAKADGHNGYIKRQRKQFRNYVLIMANSGLRVGEARYLRWEDVRYEDADDTTYVYIDVNDGKTGRRTVVAMPQCKTYFERLRARSKWIGDKDYIFVNKDGKPLDSQKNTFDALLQKCGLQYDKSGVKRSVTSLRHTYATFRLHKGDVDIYRLAENMGTGVEQIRNHYGHVNPVMFRKQLTQRT
jgi:integrase